MKNGVLIGLTIGVITATAIYQKMKDNKVVVRGRNQIVRKIEDKIEDLLN